MLVMRSTWFVGAVSIAVGTADGLLIAGIVWAAIPLALACFVHAGLVTVAIALLRRHTGIDWAQASISLLAVAVAGPVGALCAAGLLVIECGSSSSHDLLQAWYRRISCDNEPDPADLLHEAIQAGRSLRPGASANRGFPALMRHGSLAEQQALLGLIGLRYHKDFFPLLGLGLRSPQASVRAQAAAVFVNLKDRTKRRLKDNLEATDGNLLERVQEILECVESGFVDGPEARAAAGVARSLCEVVMAAQATGETLARTDLLLARALTACGDHEQLAVWLGPRGPDLSRDLKDLLGKSLIALGRYRELGELARASAFASKAMIGFDRSLNAPVLGSLGSGALGLNAHGAAAGASSAGRTSG
jgi:hypothetical protein